MLSKLFSGLEDAQKGRRATIFLFASTILVSSFLLFLVQPIIAKQILPWFGGSVGVWTTCLMFFQLALLGGYAYSDISSRLKPHVQFSIHVVLLVASLASLPIIAGAMWKPDGGDEPVLPILGLLTVTVGLPYFLLSSTGPLVQSWFVRENTDPATSQRVYRFFALSNLGSLAGLLAYPFVIEIWTSTRVQAWSWSVTYVIFVVLCAASAICSLRTRKIKVQKEASQADETPPSIGDYMLWLLLSALGSLLLMAVSIHITQNIASIPLLWVLPLSLYLLTFIVCFEWSGKDGYDRRIWIPPMLIAICGMSWGLTANEGTPHLFAVPLYCIGLFFVCMFCHGELSHARPAPRYLTRFYLVLSGGGALGGLFVVLIAPKLFNNYWELPLGLVACALMALFVTVRLHRRSLGPVFPIISVVTIGICCFFINSYGNFMNQETINSRRSFFGVLRVRQVQLNDNQELRFQLMHGVIMHGEQFVSPNSRSMVTSYYGGSSGVGIALSKIHPLDQAVGVIGLGTGTLAAYGEAGDRFRFYEINPQVIEISKKYFHYLADSRAKIETALGDARLVLEREPPQQFDILAIDAFSSDAIPVHLITREALKIYLKHIKPDGAVVFHVSNRYLELAPIVKLLADEVGMEAVLINDKAKVPYQANSDWVIVTKNREFLEDPEVDKKRTKINKIPGLLPWSDDFNNLFIILK